MPRKKAIKPKKVEKEEVKAPEPVESTHLAEAEEKLADMEAIYALTSKWGITRLSTAVNLLTQLRLEVEKLRKL